MDVCHLKRPKRYDTKRIGAGQIRGYISQMYVQIYLHTCGNSMYGYICKSVLYQSALRGTFMHVFSGTGLISIHTCIHI